MARLERAREVADELVDAFSVAGAPAEVGKRLDELGTLGVDQVAAVPAYGTTWADRVSTVVAFAGC
ncbi:hypothetical protein LWC35_36235 [Pseudonocardia kujensis]|uniref:hypothetical protein n=1 Tax=Pseudonocardia kujensis TaxID=1128675 RepID=UPI001E4F19BD|nr:hypothetical protein [Pseudonocardia kujensis]MCE0768301.1 hypothetical protein [Pseudonocardia kujensis]